MSDRMSKHDLIDLRKANLAKLNAWMGARVRLVWAQSMFGGVGLEIDQEFADDAWETFGVRVTWVLRPNPNYVPPTMDGCDADGWPIR